MDRVGPVVALALALAFGLSGCAARAMWLDGHPLLDEYLAVHVRIYRAGAHCRLEVITPTETIVTLPTRCLAIPTRAP